MHAGAMVVNLPVHMCFSISDRANRMYSMLFEQAQFCQTTFITVAAAHYPCCSCLTASMKHQSMSCQQVAGPCFAVDAIELTLS